MLTSSGRALAAAVFLGLSASASGAAAQPQPEDAPPASAQSPEIRIRQLEEDLRQLREELRQLRESQGALPTPPPPAPRDGGAAADPAKDQRPTAGWKDGFFLQSPDGDFRLRLRGYVQSDFRGFLGSRGDTGSDSFFLRRVRPILDGTLYGDVDFRIMPDFGDGRAVLQDAYLDLKLLPQAQLRVGKFKEPVSLERLQSGTELLFIERSIANNLAPIRDVGIQLSGELAKGAISYALGGFNGVSDSGSADGDAGDEKDVAWRVFAQPFRGRKGSALAGLGLGIAGSYGGRSESLSSVTYRTAGRSAFLRYDPAAAAVGTQSRLAPQLYYFSGPFGLMAEYLLSRQEARKGDVRGTLNNTGWLVQGSYVLTGEQASYRSVTPERPLDPAAGQWGAVEVAARYSQVRVDPDAFRLGLVDGAASAARARAWTLGLNWHLRRGLKVQVNYERTDFDRPVRSGAAARNREEVLLSRFQLSF